MDFLPKFLIVIYIGLELCNFCGARKRRTRIGTDVDGCAEQLFFVDGAYGEKINIGGNYLRKMADGEYRYSVVTHMSYASFDLYRMRFERGGR